MDLSQDGGWYIQVSPLGSGFVVYNPPALCAEEPDRAYYATMHEAALAGVGYPLGEGLDMLGADRLVDAVPEHVIFIPGSRSSRATIH